MKTDEELIEIALKDKNAYQDLMLRYEDKLLRYIKRLGGFNDEDARDILQETFIKAYVKLNEFNRELKFSSWIYRIAHNQSINYLRKRKIKPVFDSELNEIILNKIQADLDIEKEIDKKYLEETIRKNLNKIDKKYQEVLVLKYMEDKDYQEISDILKKPMGTIAILLKRGKEKFKKICQI